MFDRLSPDLPNIRALRKQQETCLVNLQLAGGKDVFVILVPPGFGKRLIFQLFP